MVVSNKGTLIDMPPECSSPNAHGHDRRRQQTRWKERTHLFTTLFLLALALLSPTTVAALDTACHSALLNADTNGDARLDRVEYVEAINRLSLGLWKDAINTFEYLPTELQDTFHELARYKGDEASNVQDASKCSTTRDEGAIDLIRLTGRVSFRNGDICETLRRSIHRALNAPGALTAARDSLAAAHHPCQLVSTRVLQSVSVTFQQCILAMNVADGNKDDFLNQNEYMTFVNELSDSAFEGQSLAEAPVVIRRNYFQLAGDNGQINITGSKIGDNPTPEELANLENVCSSTENAINEAISSPTAAPTGGGTTTCFIAMNRADTNDDSLLNQNEYFNFVNILGENRFQGGSFAELPQPYRQNFFMWRDPDTFQINIFGSKPGQDANADQEAFLDMVCADTQALLDTPTSPPTVPPTTPPPADVPTVTPSIPPTDSPTTTAPVPTEPPTDAPTAAPTISPTTPPTVPPTTAPPTTGPPVSPTNAPTPSGGFGGNATIQSDFIISNTAGKNADDINGSQDEADLAQAYSSLAQDVVEGQQAGRGRRLRRRRLVVTFIDNSATIESIADLARCPAGTPQGTLCQNVKAFYRVSFTEEDPNSVITDYTTATDVAINTGGLQEQLELIDPNTDLTVVEMGPTPTPAPTPAPDDGGLSNGAIAGIAVAGAVVLAGTGAFVYFAKRERDGKPNKKPPQDDVDLDSVDSFGGPGKVGSMRPSSTQANPFGGASGVQVGVGATETEYSDDDDYSFQSGSFYEDSNSTFQSPISQAGTTASQIENYKFDDPQAKQYGTAAAAGAVAGAGAAAAAKHAYESSSNAGSSGWSSSEEDTDYSNGSAYSSASSDMAESNDSFFRSDNKAAESRGDFFDEPANVTSAARPESDGSGSYGDSTFSSDFTPQPASPPGNDKAMPVPVPVPIPMSRQSDDESSEAYTTSDDSSYESTIEGRDSSRGLGSGETSIPSAALHDSSTIEKSSGETGSRSHESDLQGSLNERATELESLVEKGDWEGVIASAQKFEADTERANTPSTGSRNKLSTGSSSSTGSENSSTGSSDGSSYSSSSGVSASDSMSESRRRDMQTSGETGTSFETSGSTNYTGTSTTSETPEEARRREEYRAEVEALVLLVVPEEIDNVDVMMIQFRGREAELVSTLQNMQERSVAQRARAAVHKSKGQPPRRDSIPGQYRKDGNYSTDSRLSERTDDTYGSAAGSAAIAAASVPRPAAGGRVPIHPPPVPAHESTELESGSSTTPGPGPSPQSGESYTTSSYDDSRQRSASAESSSSSSGSSTSSSGSYDSRTGSSYSTSGASGSGSTSGSSYEDPNDEYYTSQGTGTNYDTSQGTSFTESQGTFEEDDRFPQQQRRPTQRRASIKPWLTGDDDTHADLDTSDLGVSVGGDFHSISK